MHPKYKKKYRVGNWPDYDRALVQRGAVTLWLAPHAIAQWETAGVGKRSGQLQYSDVAIETALTLRLLFHLPLRQTEGFLGSIFGMLDLDLSAPDHTTLSRRGQRLDVALGRILATGPIHLIIDSTGLSIVGEGEWAAVKHGRRGTRRRRIGWSRRLRADRRACGRRDDGPRSDRPGRWRRPLPHGGRGLRHAWHLRGCGCAWRDGRHSTDPDGAVSGRRPRSTARDRTIQQVQAVGRRQWKKDAGYHQQARAENTFFRYKSIIGESLRARSPGGQRSEAVLACNILNWMTALGRPTSYRVGQ